MSKDEFIRFFGALCANYPYTNRSEENMRVWVDALVNVPYNTALRSLDTHFRNYKEPPTPDQIAERAIKYDGLPDLIYRAIHHLPMTKL